MEKDVKNKACVLQEKCHPIYGWHSCFKAVVLDTVDKLLCNV